MFLSMHINLHLPYMCMFLLVPSVLAQNALHLDDICNLVDPPNSDMVGNDCHNDVSNQAHQVLQHSFHFFIFLFSVYWLHFTRLQLSTPQHRKIPTMKHRCAHRSKVVRTFWTMPDDVHNDDSDDESSPMMKIVF
jgi:hypothetical protein